MSGADGWCADAKTGLWTFDTGSVGRRSGFNLWRDFNDRSGTPTGLQSIAEQDATARISIMGGPGFSTFDLSASSHVLFREASDIRRSVEDLVLVVLVASGTSVAEQNGRSVVASAGDILVLFMDAPFRLAQTEGGGLKGSRLAASNFSPGLRDRSPLLLSPRFSPLAAMAASHLSWHPSDRETLSAFSDLIKDQLVALLSRGLNMVDWRADPGPHLAAEVKSMIEGEIANPLLSAKLLCARLGVSRTSLFAALAANGDTLGNLVRERRLVGCRDEMMQANGTETLAAISQRWGFRDQSTFTRAFSRRFGQPPTRWSRAVREGLRD